MFYALDRASGTIRWSYDTNVDANQRSFHGRMLFDDSLVYVGTDIPSGHVYAFEKHSGRVRWKYYAGLGVHGDIIGSGDRLYALTKQDTLICFERETGAVLWKFHTDAREGIWNGSSPCISDDRVLMRGMDSAVYAVDASNGNLVWRKEFSDRLSTSTTCLNGRIYVGSMDKNIYRLDANTGEIEASLPLDEAPYGTLIHNAGRLITFTGQRGRGTMLLCIDSGLRKIIWMQAAPGHAAWTTYRPHVWDDVVVVGDEEGAVAAFAIDDGARRWSITIEGTVKTIARSDTQMFIGTYQGILYSYGIDRRPRILR
jgi:outer membrane protein assembly factor BamB